MSAVNDEYPTHIFELLGIVLTIGKRRMEAEVAGEPQRLRGSHLRLLSLVPPEGMRPTELAVRVGMTKQSLGEFVATLQEVGFLRVEMDPGDRRARIVSPTEKGRKLQARILTIFAETEEEWRTLVGARNWAVFRRALERIAASA
jgi:DNA-binding MarR family transcriptional regulator